MKLLRSTVVICFLLNFTTVKSQTIIWTEDFGTGCNQGQLANGLTTTNGTWNVTATGTNAVEANEWFISATEAGMGAGNCGNGCLSSPLTNRTLHLGNVAVPAFGLAADNGASYNAGGFCGSFFCVETDKRVESPVIDLTGESNITLNLSYMEFGDGALDNASLWYFDGAVWSQLIDLAKTPTTCSPQGIWTAYSQLLPASADNNPNVRIGFRWINNDDGVGSDPSFAVDDITLTVPTTTGPTANFTISETTICVGETITFTDASTTSGVTTYDWVFQNGTPATANTQGPHTITFNTDGTQNITLTVTDVNGTDNITLPVTVNPLPIVTANATNTTICENDPVTLTGSGADSYVWDNGVTDGVVFNPTTTTTYTVTGTDVNGCENTDDITVTVDPLPTVIANATNTTICENDPVTLTGSGADSYVWDNGVTDGVAFNPTTTTTYTVIGTDANGCENTDDITITVNLLPTVTANATNTTICENDPVTLTGSGANSYVWDNGVTDGVAFNPTVTTTYTVIGTDANGCENTDDITVAVNNCNQPLASFTTSTSVIICEGESITFTDNSTGDGITDWIWTFDGGTPANANTQGPHNVTFNAAGSFNITLEITDANGTDDTTIVVTVNPTVTNTVNASICQGDSILIAGNYETTAGNYNDTIFGGSSSGCDSIVVTTLTVDSIPDVTIVSVSDFCEDDPLEIFSAATNGGVWSATCGTCIDPTSAEFDPGVAGAGTYMVYYEVNSSCGSNIDSIEVIVHPSPDIDIQGGDVTITQGDEVDLSVIVNPANSSYLWTPTEGLSCSDCSDPTVSPNTTTNYTVLVTTVEGCEGSASTTITVIDSEDDPLCNGVFIPTLFSPNDDGNNDEFCILSDCVTAMDLSIYNRWGELVFHSMDLEECWDGRYRDELVNSGVFVYKLRATLTTDEEIVESGNITVIK